MSLNESIESIRFVQLTHSLTTWRGKLPNAAYLKPFKWKLSTSSVTAEDSWLSCIFSKLFGQRNMWEGQKNIEPKEEGDKNVKKSC